MSSVSAEGKQYGDDSISVKTKLCAESMRNVGMRTIRRNSCSSLQTFAGGERAETVPNLVTIVPIVKNYLTLL